MSNLALQPGEKILVVSASGHLDLDKLGSAIALGKILSNTKNIKADVFLHTPKLTDKVLSVISPGPATFLEDLSGEYFTLTFDKGDAEIKEVRWEEVGDQIKIMVFTEKGEVGTKEFASAHNTPYYTKIYFLGIRDKQKSVAALKDFPDLWDSAQTYNLDIASKNKRFAQHNIVKPEFSSYAELVTSLAKSEGLQLDPQIATDLLTCLHWKTNSFTNKYSTVSSTQTLSELLQAGGNLEKAVSNVYSSKTIQDLKLEEEIYSNLTFTKEGFAFSYVSSDTMKKVGRLNDIFPIKNPLYQLKDATATFVLIPLHSKKTLVLTSSPKPEFNLKQLFKRERFRGDNTQGEFIFNTNVANAQRLIEEKIRIKPSSETNKPSTENKPPEKEIDPLPAAGDLG